MWVLGGGGVSEVKRKRKLNLRSWILLKEYPMLCVGTGGGGVSEVKRKRKLNLRSWILLKEYPMLQLFEKYY